ncbi:quinone oxidoreductase family protein [Rathayibacter toxicus]|uniref:Enoyl reductase (ER) domain-containing protein n=1 Tax=Rathayibacter toxicus TaxID=145458 RepID=A0A2S5YA03_9MICO|nr:zinc-binding alcohol dehydrogenase family protein [Rathayibacter toxicus]PPH25531.1 hypothetical protein C5D17_00455 [Rathayibacter toxicus]PPH59230.1 hypothetical protein C5D30_00440 [Rathayibacter toxicus]PPH61343.1 hypothetical protein C5C93_00455 [Rathayibacter toxicus]PPH89309.1 hypothetical protein C5D31_00460 [Rathayibacter toxicus]PPI17134.1 hypothetical protein C5C51_00440 [Rathayibacter toxicus]
MDTITVKSAETPGRTMTIDLEGTTIPLSIRPAQRPTFDERRLAHADQVLVRVDAFSCNYRDKSLIVDAALRLEAEESLAPAHFGSEFVGRVVACGASVTRWRAGDRVMPDAAYPGLGGTNSPAGIVTNVASCGWVRTREDRLALVPEQMPMEVAAAYSLGAQTSASMIRRAEVKPGDRVLVTSARSNTSLFLVTALNELGAVVVALSTTAWTEEERLFITPAFLTEPDQFPPPPMWDPSEGFDVVMDPFFDLNLTRSVVSLRKGGRYVTCGMQRQHPSFPARERPRVPIDDVFRVDEGEAFLERTFNARRRFGKVVMRYADDGQEDDRAS